MEKDFFAAVALIIEETWNAGNKILAQKMVTTRNCFCCFVGDEHLPFEGFTSELVGGFERWLLEERHVSAGTAAFYVRELSIIYSRILDKGWAADTQPFKGASLQCRSRVTTEIVTLEVIRRIRDANLSALPPEMSLARSKTTTAPTPASISASAMRSPPLTRCPAALTSSSTEWTMRRIPRLLTVRIE